MQFPAIKPFIFLCFFPIIYKAQSAAELKKAVDNSILQEARERDSLLRMVAVEKRDTVWTDHFIRICLLSNEEETFRFGNYACRSIDSLVKFEKNGFIKNRLLKRKGSLLTGIKEYYEKTEGPASKNAMKCLKEAEAVFEQINDNRDLGTVWTLMGEQYFKQGKSLEQLQVLQESLKKFKERNFKPGIARFLAQMQFFYSRLGDTAQAISYTKEALQIENEIGDPQRLARAYFQAGMTYLNLGKPDEAIENFKVSINKNELLNDKSSIPTLYFNLGEAYSVKRDFDKALQTYQLAIENAKQHDDFPRMFLSMLSIGKVYSLKGDLKKALEEHESVMGEAEKSGDQTAIRLVSSALANDYYHSGLYSKAKPYIDRALAIVRKEGVAPNILPLELLAYKTDSALKNYGEAFAHYQIYIRMKEQSNSEAVQKAATRDKLQGEFEKQQLIQNAEQEKKDTMHEAEAKRQKLILIAVSLGLVMVLALVAIVFRGYRQKQKANLELVQKNDEIAKQKELVEEKQEEILASINYAKRIQNAQIPSDKFIEKNIKRLRG